MEEQGRHEKKEDSLVEVEGRGKERGILREDKTALRNVAARIQGRPGQLKYYIGYPGEGG